ncbi:hypothetical protein K439DRAFT_1405270 [Ramaria rubella]|nr:hypothetical protein K439DRAFT_1405270 [Ramaria rubella]
MFSPGLLATATLLLFFEDVAADVSLYIPGADVQPISAGLLGVGSDGQTTWQLQQGSATGTFTDPDDFGFPGTATLIEGPNDAFLTLAVADPTDGTLAAGYSCSISGSIANCNVVASEDGSLTTLTDTETVAPFLVQGGSTTTGAGASSGPSSTASSGSPAQTNISGQATAGSTPAPSGPQSTASATVPTTTTKSPNGAHHTVRGLLSVTLVVGVLLAYIS